MLVVLLGIANVCGEATVLEVVATAGTKLRASVTDAARATQVNDGFAVQTETREPGRRATERLVVRASGETN